MHRALSASCLALVVCLAVIHGDSSQPAPVQAKGDLGPCCDLTNWKLQLPIAYGRGVLEITQPALAVYTSSYFSYAADGGIIMWCPVTGARTSGSSYPRTELREQVSLPWNTNGAHDWTFIGYHEENATMQVLQVPQTGKITVGQAKGAAIGSMLITGSCSVVVELIWEQGMLTAHLRGPPSTADPRTQFCMAATYACGMYKLGGSFRYSLRVVNSLVSVWTDAAGWCVWNYDFSWWNTTGSNPYYLYFKAGDYVQDNAGTGSTMGGKVKIRHLATRHEQLAQ